MRPLLLTTVLVLCGTGLASGGSFSAVFDPLALRVDVNIEQAVTEADGWTVYAGTGFAASREGVEAFQPYTLACQSLDALVAFAEACVELRAPLVGAGSIARAFLSVSW